MRAPTRLELLLAVVAVVAFGFWRSGVRSVAAKEAELVIVRAEREDVQRENDVLRAEKEEIDRIAADSIEVLEAIVEEAEHMASRAASAGRTAFVRILEAVPDSMPVLRALVERRERMHENEVEVLRIVIEAERDAADVLRGQLRARDALIMGVESELVVASEQIDLLESLKSPGLSTLESVSISTGAYFASTELLGASVLEGLVVGGATFVVLEGASMLLWWILYMTVHHEKPDADVGGGTGRLYRHTDRSERLLRRPGSGW